MGDRIATTNVLDEFRAEFARLSARVAELETGAQAHKDILNTQGVADLIGVVTKTVGRWVKAGRLPHVKLSADKTVRSIRQDVLAAVRKGLPKRGTPRLWSKPHHPGQAERKAGYVT